MKLNGTKGSGRSKLINMGLLAHLRLSLNIFGKEDTEKLSIYPVVEPPALFLE